MKFTSQYFKRYPLVTELLNLHILVKSVVSAGRLFLKLSTWWIKKPCIIAIKSHCLVFIELISCRCVVLCTVSHTRMSSCVPISLTLIGLIACELNYITTWSVSPLSLLSLMVLWHLHESRRHWILLKQQSSSRLMYITHFLLHCWILTFFVLFHCWVSILELLQNKWRAKFYKLTLQLSPVFLEEPAKQD